MWRRDEARFRALMPHHYLGALPGIGETLRYVAHHRGQWLALAVFSAPALKCGARDRWIGWSFGVQFDRLHLVTNNSRFLILPGAPRNLGSRVLSLCMRRLARDWPAASVIRCCWSRPSSIGHGTVYRGQLDRGRAHPRLPPPAARLQLPRTRASEAGVRSSPVADRADPTPRGPSRPQAATWSAEDDAQRRTDGSLPVFFHDIDDPRRRQGRRHALPTVLALAAAATLAACAATRRSANGSTTSAPRRWNASACAAATANTGRRACRRCAAC